jgi:HAD domain in Swiss Army Knife RNA repair proteins
MKRRIIFLDIDGVLLPFPRKQDGDELFPTSTLKPLHRLWKHVTADSHINVEWVLSSTWRVQKSYIRDIERAVFEFGIPLEFSDVTDPALHTERQWEIYDWLVKQNLGKGKEQCVWLALDDEELLKDDKNAEHSEFFEGHVVLTKSQVGLSESDIDTAIRLWDQQVHNVRGEM